MSISMVKRFFIAGLLLTGCSMSPVSVSGKLLPDVEKTGILDNEVSDLKVWLCPKNVDVYAEIEDVNRKDWGSVVRFVIERTANEKCQKAIVGNDEQSYIIEDTKQGFYTVVAIMSYSTPPSTAVLGYKWWIVPEQMRRDTIVDLTIDNSHVNLGN